jgi:hypothetical protein
VDLLELLDRHLKFTPTRGEPGDTLPFNHFSYASIITAVVIWILVEQYALLIPIYGAVSSITADET